MATARSFGAPDLPRRRAQKTTTITKLSAGHYGLLCFIPAPDGASHVAHGMVKVFDVSRAPSRSSSRRPTASSTSTLTDTAITLPTRASRARAGRRSRTTARPRRRLHPRERLDAGPRRSSRPSLLRRLLRAGHAPAGDPPGVDRRWCRDPRAGRDRRTSSSIADGGQLRPRRAPTTTLDDDAPSCTPSVHGHVAPALDQRADEPGLRPGLVRVRPRPGDEVEDARGAAGHLDRAAAARRRRVPRAPWNAAPAGLSGAVEHDRRARCRRRSTPRARAGSAATSGAPISRAERVAAAARRTPRGANRRARRTRSCSRRRRRPSCRSGGPCRRRAPRPSARRARAW